MAPMATKPQDAQKAVQQGRSERRGEEVRPALVGPFAPTMDLGERKIPSSASDFRETLVESLSDARTPLADFFSILLDLLSMRLVWAAFSR